MLLDASIALIFGGCCSNVWTLEALLKYESSAGLIVTFTQLLLTSLFALPSQLSTLGAEIPSTPSRTGTGRTDPATGYPTRSSVLPGWVPVLRRPQIPLRRLLSIAILFTTVNVMNNWAFAFDISVPLHIVLRSFGSATTMAIGALFGKRYSAVQVGAIAALTAGVVISAWADAQQKGANTTLSLTKSNSSSTQFLAGLAILFLAQVVSAFMGVYVERTYARFGRHWRENLFYSHAIGLSGALLLAPTLRRQLRTILAAPALGPVPAAWLGPLAGYVAGQRSPSHASVLLLANALTQVACISGVNRLSAQTSALTVTVVLNIRKLVSFLLSCALFGNQLGGLMVLGAAVVFGSGAVYGWDSAMRRVPPAQNGRAEGVVVKEPKSSLDDKRKRGPRKSVVVDVDALGIRGASKGAGSSGSEYPVR